MEIVFSGLSLALLTAALATFIAIVREVAEQLDEVDRRVFRDWLLLAKATHVNHAIRNAWNQHLRSSLTAENESYSRSCWLGPALRCWAINSGSCWVDWRKPCRTTGSTRPY
jgi:hypothetical protein